MGAMPDVHVLRSVTVTAGRSLAFEVFTGMDWWPVATHHLAEPPGTSVVLEPRVGGRWYERRDDGSEVDWGVVLAWNPPERILITWQVSSGWSYEPDAGKASEVEVIFTSESNERTRVEVIHRHLERYGAQAEHMREVLDRPTALSGVVEAFSAVMRVPDAPPRV